MNEQLDKIITAYEELWREAALKNLPQFHETKGVDEPGQYCGWLIATWNKSVQGLQLLVSSDILLHWQCPKCHETETTLPGCMFHLNDYHNWSWDMFANKFRTTLEEGLKEI